MAPNCNPLTTTFSVMPATATADHIAKPPGNQAQFRPQLMTTYPAGCPLPATPIIDDAIWTTSDTTNIQIDSTIGTTNGLATCVGATAEAATITAKISTPTKPLTATASLTCQ
jgi:hypothetical protein